MPSRLPRSAGSSAVKHTDECTAGWTITKTSWGLRDENNTENRGGSTATTSWVLPGHHGANAQRYVNENNTENVSGSTATTSWGRTGFGAHCGRWAAAAGAPARRSARYPRRRVDPTTTAPRPSRPWSRARLPTPRSPCARRPPLPRTGGAAGGGVEVNLGHGGVDCPSSKFESKELRTPTFCPLAASFLLTLPRGWRRPAQKFGGIPIFCTESGVGPVQAPKSWGTQLFRGQKKLGTPTFCPLLRTRTPPQTHHPPKLWVRYFPHTQPLPGSQKGPAPPL